MKTLFLLPGIMTIFGLAMSSAFAQTQSATNSNTTYIETSKFIGRPVKSAQGDQIGTVKDIVLDRNTGCLAYTVLSTTAEAAEAQPVAVRGSRAAAKWLLCHGPSIRLQPIPTFSQ